MNLNCSPAYVCKALQAGTCSLSLTQLTRFFCPITHDIRRIDILFDYRRSFLLLLPPSKSHNVLRKGQCPLKIEFGNLPKTSLPAKMTVKLPFLPKNSEKPFGYG